MQIRDTKHRIAWFIYNGRKILRTQRSHGRGELKGRIPDLIRQQLKLNEEQFRELVACPLGKEEYIQILRQKNFLSPT